MTPRLRLSIDSASDRELADSQQYYQHAHSPNTRVFVDSKGQPHDPDFMSHMFPDQSVYKRKKRMDAQRSRRASNLPYGYDDADNSDDDLIMPPTTNTDPFRPRSPPTSPIRNNYTNSSSSPASSSATWPADDSSPTSEASFKGWTKRQSRRWSIAPREPILDPDDAWEAAEKSRGGVLRRRPRRASLVDFEEEEQQPQHHQGPSSTVVQEDDDCAPTCTEALKQTWQGFYLRYRLGIHRLRLRLFPRRQQQRHQQQQSMTTYLLTGQET